MVNNNTLVILNPRKSRFDIYFLDEELMFSVNH